ncbi:MAG TPA: hypothetical protein V6C81_16075 [Planktothrix sp.]|jgi:hypothetical protein
MGFRLQNFGPMGPEELWFGWAHKLLGVRRRILKLPVTRFVDVYAGKGAPVEILRKADGSHVGCHICGYAMVSIVAGDRYRIEACSATTAPRMLFNKKFDVWRSQLPPVEGVVPAVASLVMSHLQSSTQ